VAPGREDLPQGRISLVNHAAARTRFEALTLTLLEGAAPDVPLATPGKPSPPPSIKTGEPLPELVDAFKSLVPGKLEVWPLDPAATPDPAGTIAELPPGLDEVVAIDMIRHWRGGGLGDSTAHALALRADGIVVAWGNNEAGQCEVPDGLSQVVAVSAGGKHNLALMVDGRVVTWGERTEGDLRVPADLGPCVAIAGGVGHSLAVRRDGTVAAWGENYGGQIDVPEGLVDVIVVAATEARSLALTAGGDIVAWGTNRHLEMEVPDDLGRTTAIAAIIRTEFALQWDGVLVGWGERVPNGSLRVEGVEKMGFGWELEHFTIEKQDGTWAYLPVRSGEPVPLPGASGCTTVAIAEGFVLGIRPISGLEQELADLAKLYRGKYEAEVLPAHVKEVATLEGKYEGALVRARLAAVDEGNLELAIAYRDEITRLQNKGPLPEPPPRSADAGYKTFVNAYLEQHGALEARRAARAAPLLKRYQEALSSLEETLIKASENADADRVRAFREALENQGFGDGS
jgi:hypothetical protein